jgi:5-methylcytosine-specific restriction protein A
MPTCLEDGCPEQVTRGRCPEHTTARRRLDNARRDTGAYSRDPRWRKVRALVLSRDANLCQECGAHVEGSEAHVDHKDGLGLNGLNAYDPSNLWTLCRRCHSRKTVRQDGGFGR